MNLSLRELKWGIRWSCCFKKNYSNHSVCHIIVVIASAEDIRKNITVSHESVCVMPYFYLSREKNERFFYVLFCSGYTNNSYQNNIDRA